MEGRGLVELLKLAHMLIEILSVGDKRTDFWEDMWESSGLIYEGKYDKVCTPTATRARRHVGIID